MKLLILPANNSSFFSVQLLLPIMFILIRSDTILSLVLAFFYVDPPKVCWFKVSQRKGFHGVSVFYGQGSKRLR